MTQDAEIINRAVREACELPGDDGIPDEERLVMRVSDLRSIVHAALLAARPLPAPAEDVDGLVKKLRERAQDFDELQQAEGGSWVFNVVDAKLDRDAATALTTSQDNLREAKQEIERMREALESINKVASPNPERTFDGVIRDLDYIADRARGAVVVETKP